MRLDAVECGHDVAVGDAINAQFELETAALELHAELEVESTIESPVSAGVVPEEMVWNIGDTDRHAAEGSCYEFASPSGCSFCITFIDSFRLYFIGSFQLNTT